MCTARPASGRRWGKTGEPVTAAGPGKYKRETPGRKAAGAEPHYYSDRLQRKLAQFRDFSAIMVEAPSGYGKTTAVRDYVESAVPQSASVGWFTAVDEAPGAGFRRLCREIEKIDGRTGERLLNIDLPNAFTIREACEVIRSIECRREAWLVIDDFQFLAPGLPPAFLVALFDHGASKLHIVVVTRTLGRDIRTALAGRRFLRITSSDLRLEGEDIRRYYALAGLDITEPEAQTVLRYTDGWIIAVYLQLRSRRETGAFSSATAVSLMERLVWNKLTGEQREFFLRLSPFETATVREMCGVLGRDALPEYALEALSGPLFIRYDPTTRRYEPHSLLYELATKKRLERGAAFERECLLRAGDLCRDEGRVAEALGFYIQIKAYDRILSLDLSHLIFREIGDRPFFRIALEVAEHCPAEIRSEHPLSMLRIAWALKAAGLDAVFAGLMTELDGLLAESGTLRAEWFLLSAYARSPHLDQMLPLVRKAAPLFEGTCSRVILPEAPWGFGGYFQMTEFHLRAGAADREAGLLEEFVALYSQLTNGHGSGADALFRAEIAYLRGDLAAAEISAYKAGFLADGKRQSIVQLGAAKVLADIALVKGDTVGWQRAINALERVASQVGPNTFVIRPVLDTIRGAILTELQKPALIADWLKTGDFSSRPLLPPMAGNALYVHVMFLLHQGELTRFIGTQQALPAELIAKSAFSAFLHPLLSAIGYAMMGKRAQAAEFLERAAEKALPDGFILSFAASSWLLQGLVEELVKEKYPALFEAFKEVKARFGVGWEKLHKAVSRGELPDDLTAREREIALLAAEGLRNSEIAGKLRVTESTVRTHLRAIFQKLDIDRRAKLANKLK